MDRSAFKELSAPTEDTQITIEYQRVHVHLSKNLDPAILMKYLKCLKEMIEFAEGETKAKHGLQLIQPYEEGVSRL